MGERAAHEVAPLAADRRPRVAAARHPRRARRAHQPRRVSPVVSRDGADRVRLRHDRDEVRDARASREAPFIGFALGYLFAMAEMGLYCPLCMTDGVARVLTRHGTREQIDARRAASHLDRSRRALDRRHVPHRARRRLGRRRESDRRAQMRTARRRPDRSGSARMSTPRRCWSPRAPKERRRGRAALRTFLLLTRGNPGVTIERLKEKLGVRSMPTGE